MEPLGRCCAPRGMYARASRSLLTPSARYARTEAGRRYKPAARYARTGSSPAREVSSGFPMRSARGGRGTGFRRLRRMHDRSSMEPRRDYFGALVRAVRNPGCGPGLPPLGGSIRLLSEPSGGLVPLPPSASVDGLARLADCNAHSTTSRCGSVALPVPVGVRGAPLWSGVLIAWLFPATSRRGLPAGAPGARFPLRSRSPEPPTSSARWSWRPP